MNPRPNHGHLEPDVRCAHPACACPASTIQEQGRFYCSPACANPKASADTPCPCGHAACGTRPDPVERVKPPAPRSPAPDVLVPPAIL